MTAPYRPGDRLSWAEITGKVGLPSSPRRCSTLRKLTRTPGPSEPTGGRRPVDSHRDGVAGVQVAILEDDVTQELDIRGEGYIVEPSATDHDYDWHIDTDRNGYGYGR